MTYWPAMCRPKSRRSSNLSSSDKDNPMTDMQAAHVQGTAPLSTSIDQGGAPLGTGGGIPNLNEPKPVDPKPEAKPAKPESAGDTLKGELARIRDEEAEKAKEKGADAAKDAKAKVDEAEKSEKGEKPVEKAGDKADTEDKEPARKAEKSDAEKLATGQEGEDKPRQSEGSKRNEPPARFLPKAKEHWINVPHSVRDEVHRMADEHEAEVTKYKASSERYEPIRQFDEIAKSNGRELKDSLTKVVQVEQALARNPIMGLDMILREIGPRKPDGTPLSLYEVAQHIAQQSPQQFHQAMQGAHGQHEQAQERQKTQTEVQQLREELNNMRVEATAQSIIAPFAASHPRYHELQDDIAFFLQSGKIPASLSPAERLSAAYDMAERINPVGSRSMPALKDTTEPVAAKPAPDDSGAKSIRGAPNGQDPDEDDDPDATDIRKLLRREMRKAS
ncbi:hypothetical protein [Mesorhizobium sp. BE184]|uniref:hypothetical protein n=1 Tax=Mesorhizobium sp. BE184 TaxID=2817714 RepID=UPI0028610CCB|nr:hypothetical protein [Mesorhizobium sp. BE184]MDR7032428.1 hypothetical protein [Mesorhizobium sp. BE184]